MPNRLLILLFPFAFCIVALRAWSPHHQYPRQLNRGPTRGPCLRSTVVLLTGEDGPEELIQDNTGEESTAVYGVSYIGGDPCGSKYNDDPFDATAKDSFKPGLPDDMKDRIAALAAKKAQELKESEN